MSPLTCSVYCGLLVLIPTLLLLLSANIKELLPGLKLGLTTKFSTVAALNPPYIDNLPPSLTTSCTIAPPVRGRYIVFPSASVNQAAL